MSNPLLARFAGMAAAVAPEALNRVEACLDAVMAIERGPAMLHEGATADDGFWPEPGSWKAAYRPYVVVDGMLQIPVKGVLLHDFSYAIGSYATGYLYIRRAFERGATDPAVKGIALVCDSPGGEVAGCFDLVDAMHAAKGGKPVWAFAHEAAYSAAYAVASVADKIWVSRTGGVGSIGVVTFHVDRSGALEKAGLKITFIHAGKHKVDGNSTQPLPADVRARIQARIDALMAIFVSTVARNRRMPEAKVRATEALTYSGAEGIAAGLADAVGSVDDAVAAFAADLGPSDAQDEQLQFASHVRARHGLAAASAEPAWSASIADRMRAFHPEAASRTSADRLPASSAPAASLADRMRAHHGLPPGQASAPETFEPETVVLLPTSGR